MMSKISRRRFLATTGTVAATAAWAARPALAEPSPIKVSSGVDIVTLGKSGINSSVLGVGTGTRGGREQFFLGQAKFTRLIRQAYDLGIRYIDTADMYRTHIFVGFALKELPRDEIFIQTKTRATHPEVAKADIERFRRELQTDHLDTLLMHAMRQRGWPTDLRPVLDVLLDAKRKGRIRAVGASCHGMDPLVDAAGCDELDVHLVRINPFGTKMDGTPDQVAAQVQKMHEKGHGVIGMKIYGEGTCDTRQKRLQSLKYVLGLGTVHAFTIGFSSIGQIEETLELIKQAAAS